MSKLQQLISLLADGEFHSGEQLGEALEMTRSGIWKQIKQLPEMGIVIDSVHGKGYRIYGGLELLDARAIKAELSIDRQPILRELALLETVDSTSNYVMDKSRQQQETIACVAEQQSAGRGRRGNAWFSPYAQSISLSLAWHFNKDPSILAGLSLATAVAVTRGLNRFGINSGLGVKWPNDILWEGRKLAGILLEFVGESNGYSSVVIGLGMNLNIPPELSNYIDQSWVDVKTIIGQRPKRNRLIGIILDELLLMLQQFETDGLALFMQEWETLDIFRGEHVSFKTVNGETQGKMVGIGKQGELLLQDTNGETRAFFSGELKTLRKN